ncbi:MAG: uncharacterized protein HLUCCA01_02535 [Bacteroidetes bacterium HLUCCA01]|nr:MAG: uncharacterized protein HLUCCA01_02535 [Bacteroidetes bacterium HLUCCA01]
MNKLQFRINELPKGSSQSRVFLTADELDIAEFALRDLVVEIQFIRREAMIEVDFSVEGEVQLRCDRSLRDFWSPLRGDYSVLFKESADFESEDEQTAVRRLEFSANILDIAAEVRDTVLLSVPVRRIHPDYYDEYGNLQDFNHVEGERNAIDPRWEALRALKDNSSKN